jgi:chromosome segregation ATPase
MMNKEMKKKAIQDLMVEVYSDYLKHLAVYNYIGEKYADDMKEDTDKLGKELAEVRAKQLELMTKIKDKEISDEDKEKFTEEFNQTGVDIDKLDKRIEFCKDKVADYENAKNRVNETVEHYERLRNWYLSDFTEKEPEYVK